jgi:glycosyltransferase involved in cell wall biosynthesis
MSQSRPHVVHYWHLAGLSSALFAVTLPQDCRAVCDVSSGWLLDLVGTGGNWFRLFEKRAGSAWKRAAKRVLAPVLRTSLRVPTQRPHWPPGPCTFTSVDLLARYRDADVDVGAPVLLDSGVDLDRFRFVGDRDWTADVTLLFLSRVKRFKGLHTAVAALARLPQRFRLRAIGAVDEPAYLDEVHALVRDLGLASRFSLEEQIDHDAVPRVMSEGHLLVFGSEGPEAFSRMVLEAFAVGTPVVGTTLGGTAQVLRDGDTGYVFAPGDADDLARQIRRAADDAPLREDVVARARELVASRYTIEHTVSQIEAVLAGTLSAG